VTNVVLAFDFGLKHIGVAVGQSITRSASPLTTISARDGRPDWRQIVELVEQWRPDLLIVGLPLNMDDSESEMSERARAFSKKLHAETALEVVLVDERLSSFEAKKLDDANNHAHAARLIAETWLGQG
jgi:putative Holliday junction resolvase